MHGPELGDAVRTYRKYQPRQTTHDIMTAQTLFDLYLHELKDLYSAESQLIEALPKMAEAATHSRLRKAFEDHLEETRKHQQRLEEIFEDLGEDPAGETCEAMKGLVAEGEDVVEMEGDDNVRDAALIGAAQRAEHYEISAYGTTATFARALGREDDEDILRETLDEEYEADDLLTDIAEEVVNQDALESSLPIDGYQGMTADEIDDQLGRLDADALRRVRDFEQTHKRRKTVVENIDARMDR